MEKDEPWTELEKINNQKEISEFEREYEIPKDWHRSSNGFESNDGMMGICGKLSGLPRYALEMIGFKKKRGNHG